MIFKSVVSNFKTYMMPFTLFWMIVLMSCAKDAEPIIPDTNNPLQPVALTSKEVIDSMGTGFNLGNTFDYPLQSTDPEDIYPIIDLYAEAGMNHIRIPITWMDGFDGNTLADENGNINFNHQRFIQIKAVIDYAIQKEMFVVINAHHEHWLFDNYDGSGIYNLQFSNLWTNIATHFADYSDLLIFEVLNEPQGVFGDWVGGANPLNNRALALTRTINKVAYDAIRATGGNNAHRIIMVSTNGMGNHNQLNDVYPVKDSLPGEGLDKHLSFHVHTYDPWDFCGHTGNNDSYPGNNAIINPLKAVADHAKNLDVPVNYGEFGVGRQTNQSERNTAVVRDYYKIVRQTCLAENMSPTVWEDRGWFGLINGENEFIHDIVPHMMGR